MEIQAANIILKKAGPQDCFTIEGEKKGIYKILPRKWRFKSFQLAIKPIIARDFIEICEETSRIQKITENDVTLFQAALLYGNDIKYIAKSIAIATGTQDRESVTNAILGLDFDNIERLWKIVQRQSDPERFFFIFVATGKMNLLKKQQE